MILTGTLEKAREGRRHEVLPNGAGYWRNRLITSDVHKDPIVSPQAYLVEQDPNSIIEPHFHQENEFQVMVEGNGFLGRHLVEPVRVHYAGAHTGYGPISAGPKGLSYFTLRARTDPGAKFLPGARAEMQKGPKRHLLGAAVHPEAPDELAARTDIEVVELWAAQPDGIGGWLLRLPPGSTAAAPVRAGASAYLLVVEGIFQLNNERLPRFATVFVGAGDAAPSLQAGDEGLELLVLQFPTT
jgi:hypothetical protein